MYVIIKEIPISNGTTVPVILLDGATDEILEFEKRSEADGLCVIFNANSDSGYSYSVKKV